LRFVLNIYKLYIPYELKHENSTPTTEKQNCEKWRTWWSL